MLLKTSESAIKSSRTNSTHQISPRLSLFSTAKVESKVAWSLTGSCKRYLRIYLPSWKSIPLAMLRTTLITLTNICSPNTVLSPIPPLSILPEPQRTFTTIIPYPALTIVHSPIWQDHSTGSLWQIKRSDTSSITPIPLTSSPAGVSYITSETSTGSLQRPASWEEYSSGKAMATSLINITLTICSPCNHR